MLVVLMFGICFGVLRTYLRPTGISGVSVGADGWNLPAIFVHVTRSIVRSGRPVATRDKLELFSCASIVFAAAGCMTGIVWRHTIRMRRARLDRQLPKWKRVDVDKPGAISGLARLTRPIASSGTNQSGEPKRA
jgi:hypothetical protein